MMHATDRKARGHFHRISHATSYVVGSACALAAVIVLTFSWMGYGWWGGFSIRWFLATNLGMTVSIFLILLLLQHSRRIHMRAIHTKLDELIRTGQGGNHMIASEKLADEMLEELREKHRELVKRDRD